MDFVRIKLIGHGVQGIDGDNWDPKPKAIDLAKATPTRNPVEDPGPTVTATACS